MFYFLFIVVGVKPKFCWPTSGTALFLSRLGVFPLCLHFLVAGGFKKKSEKKRKKTGNVKQIASYTIQFKVESKNSVRILNMPNAIFKQNDDFYLSMSKDY